MGNEWMFTHPTVMKKKYHASTLEVELKNFLKCKEHVDALGHFTKKVIARTSVMVD